jgi:molybdenum cofactor cytidylyltransferase
MKTPKPFLKFDSESLFIDKTIREYIKFGCSKLIITINEEHSFWKEIINKYSDYDSIMFAPNRHPEYERFYSVKIGLEHTKDLDYCFIQDIDNPFIDIDILDVIFDKKTVDGYNVPTYNNKGGHPILLGKELIKQISSTSVKQQNLKEFLKNYKRNNISVDTSKILININSPEEYSYYFGNNFDN